MNENPNWNNGANPSPSQGINPGYSFPSGVQGQPVSSNVPAKEEPIQDDSAKLEDPQKREQRLVRNRRLFWVLIVLIALVSGLLVWEIVDLCSGGFHL